MLANTNKSRPTFSIVIPTYNRAEYLRFTLETCLYQTYPFAEFIIQDDCSTDGTATISKEYVEKDNRFRYCNIGENVGMRGNFERSLAITTGDYLIFLGGDDALIPQSLNDLADIIGRHSSKIITWPVASYHYAEARHGKSQIIAPHSIFQPIVERELPSSEYFQHQVDRLFYVNDEKSPMIYVKSAVPRSIIHEVQKASNGLFFSSSTPDGYSGFAVASVVPSYVYTNKTLTMHGVSPSSQGLNYVSGSNDKNDHSKKFFRDSKSIPMAPQLGSEPYSPLISVMTADFIFQTDNIFGHGFSKNLRIENLIDKALHELCDGLFSSEKIGREIEIIYRIALKYNKIEHFNNSLHRLRRNQRSVLSGEMISPSLIYISALERKIDNVYKAAKFVHQHRNKKIIYSNLKWPEAIFNSIRYKLKSYKYNEYLSSYFTGNDL